MIVYASPEVMWALWSRFVHSISIQEWMDYDQTSYCEVSR